MVMRCVPSQELRREMRSLTSWRLNQVPVPHFGLALTKHEFDVLAARVEAAGVDFIIPPTLRFEGAPGEQWTMFFKDPSVNKNECLRPAAALCLMPTFSSPRVGCWQRATTSSSRPCPTLKTFSSSTSSRRDERLKLWLLKTTRKCSS